MDTRSECPFRGDLGYIAGYRDSAFFREMSVLLTWEYALPGSGMYLTPEERAELRKAFKHLADRLEEIEAEG